MKDTVKGNTPDPEAMPGLPTTERLSDGQYADHFVLSEEDRRRGHIRPYRTSYKHVGIRPEYPTRPLTEEEFERYADLGYVCFEEYPEGSHARGRFWTNEQLNSGCGSVTTMPVKCAETYAVQPTFYGKTFCCHCEGYFRVGDKGEFVWLDDGSRVGT